MSRPKFIEGDESRLMGRNSRPRVQKLAEKLRAIRRHLAVSQTGMYLILCPGGDPHNRAIVSMYERGAREPSLLEMLAYARSVEVFVDVLIDDRQPLIISTAPGIPERRTRRR